MSDGGGGTVKLPAIGTVPSKYVYGGGALVLGIAGYAWWHRGTSAAAAVVDPNAAADPALDQGAGDGSDWPFRPGGSTVTPGDAGSSPTTPQEWSTAAVDALANSFWDTQQATTAVGKYIAQDPAGLTPAEVLMIQAALALVGTVPGGKSYRIIPAHITTTTPPAAKPPVKPTGNPALVTIAAGRSMYDYAKMAHPSANAAAANLSALNSIHYNIGRGINPWPRGRPGFMLTQYKLKKATPVYIL